MKSINRRTSPSPKPRSAKSALPATGPSAHRSITFPATRLRRAGSLARNAIIRMDRAGRSSWSKTPSTRPATAVTPTSGDRSCGSILRRRTIAATAMLRTDRTSRHCCERESRGCVRAVTRALSTPRPHSAAAACRQQPAARPRRNNCCCARAPIVTLPFTAATTPLAHDSRARRPAP